MKKILGLLLLLVSFASYGQFSNYTNINGRYKWIAGKFDSTFTLPSGTTPSLRVGGGTGPGALFYSTTDSSVYQYTGNQWTRLRGTDTAHVISAYVRNTTGSILTPGQVVYINGSTGTTPTVALAVNTADSTSAMTFGFVRGNIAINGFGWITAFGPLEGVNTNAYDEGEVIYLDSIPGQFTHDKPQAPYHMVTLGYIVKKSGGNGTIFAKIQNGYELEELHNVRITAPVLNKSVIIYDSVNGLWVDTTVSAAGLGLGGSGTTNYLSKWTSSSVLGNSLVYDDGTSTGINSTPSASGMLVIDRGALTESIILNSTNATNRIRFQNTANNQIGIIQFDGNGFGIGCGGSYLSAVTIGRTTNHVGIFGSPDASFRLNIGGTFKSSGDANINGLTVGKGGGSVAENTAIGNNALNANTTSIETTAIGYYSFRANTIGNKNTGVGTYSGYDNVSGIENTFVGAYAGRTSTASHNTMVGSQAGRTTTGGFNTFIGSSSGYSVSTGTYNTIVGYSNPGITTGNYNTIIGSGVTGLSSSLSNTIILADGQGNQRLRIPSTGNVLIGTSTDGGYKLSVSGTANISGGSNVALLVDNSGTLAALRLQNSTYAYLVFNRAGTVARSFGIFNASGDIGIQDSQTWSGTNYHIFYGNGDYSAVGSGLFGSNGTANASAILQANSTTKGFLPPRMTGAQAEAIATPAAGLMVYANNGNGTTITSTGWWGYDGTNWVKLN